MSVIYTSDGEVEVPSEDAPHEEWLLFFVHMFEASGCELVDLNDFYEHACRVLGHEAREIEP